VEPEEAEADIDADYDDNADALASSYDGRLMDDTSPTSNSSDIDEIGGDDESLDDDDAECVTTGRH
jgi:hypothetical protein